MTIHMHDWINWRWENDTHDYRLCCICGQAQMQWWPGDECKDNLPPAWVDIAHDPAPPSTPMIGQNIL